MDKITQINVEGDSYQFVAGHAVKAACAASADDWVKTVILPEGAALVEGLTVAILFLNGNSAGFTGNIDAYSDDGQHFYYDDQLTQPVTLPPLECYTMTFVEGQKYSFSAYPVISINSIHYPVCDSRGKPCGGPIWTAGDTIASLFLNDKFLMLHNTVTDEVKLGVSLPVTSNAVARDCLPVNEVALNNLHSVSSNAVAEALGRFILPYLYIDSAQYWFKIGRLKYTYQAEHFPFVIMKLNVMGYFRSDNSGEFLLQVGLYDRTSLARRMTRNDIVRTGNANCALAVDSDLNVWVQPYSTYGSGFALNITGSRDFELDFRQGNSAALGTPSGFTSLGVITSATSVTF